MFKSITFSLLYVSHLLVCAPAFGGSFSYPEASPTPVMRATPPAWLSGGRGDDGYVTVTTEVVMPNISCEGLGDRGGLLQIRKEKMQLVVSQTTSGFKSNLDGQEIPIATFDGRYAPGQCAVLSTLPLTVIPFARLESFSDVNSGNLSLLVNIKSSTDGEVDLISAGQLLLGTAAVFASGGAGSTIAGLTSTLAKPALADAQNRVNAYLSNVVPGQARISLDWPTIRTGIHSITIPVYIAKTDWSETPSRAIARFQSNPNLPKNKLFDVVLRFSYTKTLFDPKTSGKDELPSLDTIASDAVLNYPNHPGIPNFLQLLNSTSPSHLQTMATATTPKDFAEACGKVIQALDNVGLDLLDRAVTTKSFVDEAKKGTAWYANNVENCFRDYPATKKMVLAVYGKQSPNVPIQDAQSGDGSDVYQNWYKQVVPIISTFRRVMEVNEDRPAVLQTFNGGADISVDLLAGASSWASQPTALPDSTSTLIEKIPATSEDTHPGITKLSIPKVAAGGCFVYDTSSLDPNSPGGHMVLVTESGDLWHLNIMLQTQGNGKIRKIEISRLDMDWRDYFFNKMTYPGGECQIIQKKYKL